MWQSQPPREPEASCRHGSLHGALELLEAMRANGTSKQSTRRGERKGSREGKGGERARGREGKRERGRGGEARQGDAETRRRVDKETRKEGGESSAPDALA
jgi:hypothetical protein